MTAAPKTSAKSGIKPLESAYKKQIQHLKTILGRKDIFIVERTAMVVLAAIPLLLPAMVVRWVGGWGGYLTRKTSIELYACVKPLILLFLLVASFVPNNHAVAIAAICLVDVFSYLLGLVFLSWLYTKPASVSRSVLLLVVNFVEIVLGFAVLYLKTGSIALSGTTDVAITSWHYAVYFSAVTFGTVGYGDVIPITALGRLFVTLQIFGGFLFMAIVLSTFVAQLQEQRAKA